MSKRKDYACNQCDYTTTRKFNMERHAKVHENEMCSNRIPVIVDQTIPTQVGYGALTPSVQTESNNNNTVITENYDKVVDIAKGWNRE